MNLDYSGTIPVSVDDVWAVLSDLERVAACLPGVRLDQNNGDEVAGTVTVPLGPLRLTYRGEAAFVERDRSARRVVIDAAGRDSHGEQAASARVTVQLRPDGNGTQVTAVADVNVRGMSAPVGFAVREFGTGLLREFVSRLGAIRRTAAKDTPEPAAGAAGAAGQAGGAAPGAGDAASGASQPAGQPVPKPAAQAAAQATATPHRVPEPRPQPSARPRATPNLDEAVYPVPPLRAGTDSVPAAVQYAPYAGAVAVGVLLGWLVGRRRKR